MDLNLPEIVEIAENRRDEVSCKAPWERNFALRTGPEIGSSDSLFWCITEAVDVLVVEPSGPDSFTGSRSRPLLYSIPFSLADFYL